MLRLLVFLSCIVCFAAASVNAGEEGVRLYDVDGPNAVTEVLLTVPSPSGVFATTAYIPSDPRPHPIVIFSPGFAQMGIAYAPYAKRLASWGIIAFLRDDPIVAYALNKADTASRRDDLSRIDNPMIAEMAVKTVLDITYEISTWLPAANADVNSPLYSMVDAARVGLAGHSRGGQIALLAGEALPGRVKGVFALDPVDLSFGSPQAGTKLANIGIPIALIGETTDKLSCAPAWVNYQTLYDAAASPAVAITALNADHTMFEDPANCLFCSLCKRGTADASGVLAYSVRYLTAFFARELLGDQSVGSAFAGAGAAADVKAGLILISSK